MMTINSALSSLEGLNSFQLLMDIIFLKQSNLFIDRQKYHRQNREIQLYHQTYPKIGGWKAVRSRHICGGSCVRVVSIDIGK